MQENDVNVGVPTLLPDGRKFFPLGTRARNPSFARMRLNTYDNDSSYNALQLSASRRFSQGLQFQVSYSFSKTLDTGSLMNRGDGDDRRQRTRQDPFDKNADRGLSDLHFANNLVVSGAYELPLGRGKRYGGWQLNAIFTATSGHTFNPKVGFDVDRDASTENDARPNRLPGARTILGGVEKYFNPNVFTLQEAGFYGNAGRNILVGPGLRTLDLSLIKNTRLGENLTVQFRAEGFNVMNRANFGIPLTTVFDSRGEVFSAGRITDTLTTARQIQLGLKIIF